MSDIDAKILCKSIDINNVVSIKLIVYGLLNVGVSVTGTISESVSQSVSSGKCYTWKMVKQYTKALSYLHQWSWWWTKDTQVGDNIATTFRTLIVKLTAKSINRILSRLLACMMWWSWLDYNQYDLKRRYKRYILTHEQSPLMNFALTAWNRGIIPPK